MSGLFGSPTIKGTRITDFAKTSADVGGTIPFLHGRAPVPGNVVMAKLPPTETKTVKKQGKGGVKQEIFTYDTTYAIYFCTGPIIGYWWIKRNGKVVYSLDPAAPVEDKAYAAKWAAKVQMYNGTMSQMPSSVLEAIRGVGKVSAMRGGCYIVLPRDDITEGGGAIPVYEAVPIASPSEVWLTSKPYAQLIEQPVDVAVRVPFILIEELLKDADAATDRERIDTRLTGGALAEALGATLSDDEVVSITLAGGELKESPVGNIEDREVDITTLSGGALTAVPTGYPKDDLEVNSIALTGGEMTATLPAGFGWNPLDKGSYISLSDGNLSAAVSADTINMVRVTNGKTSGKWCLPVRINHMAGSGISAIMLGMSHTYASLTYFCGSGYWGWGFNTSNGNAYFASSGYAYGGTCVDGDVVEILFDAGANTVRYAINGVVQNGGTPAASDLYDDPMYASVSLGNTSASVTIITDRSSYAIANGYELWA